MIPVLQCGGCEYGKTLDWILPETPSPEYLGALVCSQYKEGIPDYVEDTTADCPRFEEK